MPRPKPEHPTQLISMRLPREVVRFLDELAEQESRTRTSLMLHHFRRLAEMRGVDLNALRERMEEG